MTKLSWKDLFQVVGVFRKQKLLRSIFLVQLCYIHRKKVLLKSCYFTTLFWSWHINKTQGGDNLHFHDIVLNPTFKKTCYCLKKIMWFPVWIEFGNKYVLFTQVPGVVQDILYLTAILNSCINPLIYGVYYYRDKDNRRRAGTVRY